MCFSMPDIPKVEPPPMVVEESPEKKQVEMATARRKAAGRFGIGDTWLSRWCPGFDESSVSLRHEAEEKPG